MAAASKNKQELPSEPIKITPKVKPIIDDRWYPACDTMITQSSRFLQAMRRLQKAVHRKEKDVQGEKSEFESSKKELEATIKQIKREMGDNRPPPAFFSQRVPIQNEFLS